MNREEVIKALRAILASFKMHDAAFRELQDILAKSGVEKQFLNTLISRLKALRQFGIMATRLEEFEILKQSRGIFSMHVQGRGYNVRFLYYFTREAEPIFLLTFYEQAGKRTTDYTKYIPLAEQRRGELEEE